jgi:hypothetical protein
MTHRSWVLTIILGSCLGLVYYRAAPGWLSRGPRLIFENRAGGSLDMLTVIYGGDRYERKGVRRDESIVLPFTLSAGVPLSIQGQVVPAGELARLITIAGRQRSNITASIDVHGCLVLEGFEINPLTRPDLFEIAPHE